MEFDRPIVLVDCDGVLSRANSMFFDCIEPILGRRPDDSEVTQWSILGCFNLDHFEPACDAMIIEKRMCLNMPEYDGAFEAIDALRTVASVHCVTAPYHTDTWVNERRQWLRTRFGFAKDEIHFTSGKYICQGDVFIDDNLEHALLYAKRNAASQIFLWDRPWNQTDDQLPFNVKRSNDWNDVIYCVKNIVEERKFLQ